MDLLNKISATLKESTAAGEERRPPPPPSRPPPGNGRRRLTKEDIGNPMDFRHEVHIGWDSPIGAESFSPSNDAEVLTTKRERNYSERVKFREDGAIKGAEENRPRSADNWAQQQQQPPPQQPQKQWVKKPRRIAKEDIGRPMNFRHKAHIGWNHFYGFNLDTSGEPMDPTVSEIFQQIRKAIGTEAATTEGEAKGMHSPTQEQKPQKKKSPPPIFFPLERHSMMALLPPSDQPAFNPNCVQIFIDDRNNNNSQKIGRKVLKPLPPTPAAAVGVQLQQTAIDECHPQRPLSDCSFFGSTTTRTRL